MRYLSRLGTDRGGAHALLRLVVTADRDCSSPHVSVARAATGADDDCLIEGDAFGLLVDPITLHYLAGADIDYERDNGVEKLRITAATPPGVCACSP